MTTKPKPKTLTLDVNDLLPLIQAWCDSNGEPNCRCRECDMRDLCEDIGWKDHYLDTITPDHGAGISYGGTI